MSKFYDVIEDGVFFINVKYCPDIMKLSDNFLSEEQIKEIDSLNFQPKATHSQKIFRGFKIQDVCDQWITHIKEGAACTSYTNSEIKVMLSEVPHWIRARYIPGGYEISGARIYNTALRYEQETKRELKKQKIQQELKKQKEEAPYIRQHQITSMDTYYFDQIAQNVFETKYNCHLNSCSNTKLYQLIKRTSNWSEFKKTAKQIIVKKQYPQDIKWIYEIWKNGLPNRYPNLKKRDIS